MESFRERNYDFSDFKDLVSQAESVEAKIPEFVEFYVPKDQMFIKENPKLTVVTALKANAIEDLLRQHKDSLFAYNIRTYLGEKGINKDIRFKKDIESYGDDRCCRISFGKAKANED